MTITKTSYVERVLIVLNPDGTLKGAHSQTLDTIAEDGVVLRESQGDAVQVEAASLASVLPDQAALMAQIEALKVERESLAYEVASLTQQVEALTPPPVDLPTQIKRECERRIYDVADAHTQMNMVAAAVAGILDEGGRAALASAVQWVGAMRAACVALIAAEDETFQNGAHWPPCPPDVVALANAF